MDTKYKIPFALAVLTVALSGCSMFKHKAETVKPNPLPKIVQAKQLVPVFSESVAATKEQDPLSLRMDADHGTIFTVDPRGEVAAYQNKKRLWQVKVGKLGLSSGVTAAEGIVVVGNEKGQLFALDQTTGKTLWKAQLSGSLLSPALIHSGRVVIVANDGTVYAYEVTSGQQAWTYKLPNTQFSLRGQASPVAVDARTIVVASANAYVYAIDVITGVPLFQRRVAVSEGRSEIKKLVDVDAEPVIAGQFMVTTSFQGQVTVIDLATQRVVWSQDVSSVQRAAVKDDKVFVSHDDGKLTAYLLTSGEKIWELDSLLNRHLSNPVMLGKDLVVGDFEGVLHLIDPYSGQLIGRSKTSGAIRSLRVIDGQLYVSTRKGALSVWQNR